jgi:hypothetical protein
MAQPLGFGARFVAIVALVAVLIVLVTGGTTSAHSGYTVSRMSINQEHTEYVSPSCYNRLMHGNIYATAFSKVKYTTSACYTAVTWVTACAGLNCPNGPVVRTYNINTWVQSNLPWKSVIWSHYVLQTDSGTFEQHHRNVF